MHKTQEIWCWPTLHQQPPSGESHAIQGKSANSKAGPKLADVLMEALIEMVRQNESLCIPKHPQHKDSIKSENISLVEKIHCCMVLKLQVREHKVMSIRDAVAYLAISEPSRTVHSLPANCTHAIWTHGDKVCGNFTHKNYGHPTDMDMDTWRHSLRWLLTG